VVSILTECTIIETELVDLQTQLQMLTLDYKQTQKLYTKNPTPYLEEQVKSKFMELSRIKLQLKDLQQNYKLKKKIEEKDQLELIESQRKQIVFELFEHLCMEKYIVAIPELKDKIHIWNNIYWWENGHWVTIKESTTLLPELKSRAAVNQYIIDKNDEVEFNNYIQSNKSVFLNQWNKYLLFQNGLLDSGRLVPNMPEYFTFEEYQFNLLSQKTLKNRIDFAFLIYNLKKVTPDWDEIGWYIGNCLRKQNMEYFLFFLGPPSGGKSPWAKCIRRLFKKIGIDAFDTLGDNGGLNTSYDKQINIDFDANMAFLTAKTVSKIKQIYGDDPEQSVRLLFLNTFSAKISPYMVVLINTMPKLPPGVNATAVFKRAHLCDFYNILEDNPDFKEMTQEQDFIDLFGSFCYWKSFDEKLEDGRNCNLRIGRLNEFVNETEKKWLNSAYAVRTAIQYLCKRSIKIEDVINVRTLSAVVQMWFSDPKLNPLSMSLPSEIVGDITEAVHLMGGDKCIRQKQNMYEGIWWTPEGLQLFGKYNMINQPQTTTFNDQDIQQLLDSAEKFEGFNDMEK